MPITTKGKAHDLHRRMSRIQANRATKRKQAPPLKSVRGPHELMGFKGYITVHPSSLLRIRDGGERHRAFDAFRDDLERVARLARSR